MDYMDHNVYFEILPPVDSYSRVKVTLNGQSYTLPRILVCEVGDDDYLITVDRDMVFRCGWGEAAHWFFLFAQANHPSGSFDTQMALVN